MLLFREGYGVTGKVLKSPCMTGIKIPYPEELAYVPEDIVKLVRAWWGSTFVYNRVSLPNASF